MIDFIATHWWGLSLGFCLGVLFMRGLTAWIERQRHRRILRGPVGSRREARPIEMPPYRYRLVPFDPRKDSTQFDLKPCETLGAVFAKPDGSLWAVLICRPSIEFL